MSEIYFTVQKNGYDKAQVDNYIHKITEAYKTTYDEYLAVCEKYNVLMRDYQKLESDKKDAASAEIIAKTLINSEKLAKEIIDNAHDEGNRMIDLTVKNLQYAYTTLENAMNEVAKFLTFNNCKVGEECEPSKIIKGEEEH